MLVKIVRLVAYTLAGALALPFVAFVFAFIIYMADPRCGTPGDSGGCEMGLGAMVMAATPVGAMLGFLFGLWRVLRKRPAKVSS